MLGGNRLWRHTDFVKLWTGQTVSVVGSQVTTLALPTIAILLLHATPAQVGLLAALERLAFPVFALFAGVWIDRVRRRPLMIGADTVRAAALISIPLVATIGTLTLIQLYAVAALLGVGTVIFDIAYLAYVPTLVGRADLLEANTKLEVSNSGSYLFGPGLAGGLIQLIGAAQAVLADALSFLVSVATIVWIRQPESRQHFENHPRLGVLAELWEGVRLVFGNRILRSMALMLTAGAVGFHLAEPAFYLFGYRSLGLSPGAMGLVFATGGVGAVIGALAVGTVVRTLGLGRALAFSIFAVGTGFLIWPLAVVLLPLATLMGAELLVGASDSIFNISQVSLRQSVTPDHLQGRMTATLRTMFWGAWPLANIVGGILAGVVGAPLTIVIGGLLGMASAAMVVFGPLGRLREQPAVANRL